MHILPPDAPHAQPTPACSETCHGAPAPPLGSVRRTSSLTCPNWAYSPTQLRAIPLFLTRLCTAPTQSPVCWVTLNPPGLPSFEGHSFLPLGVSPVVHPGLSKGGQGQGLAQVEGWRCQVGGRGDEGLVCLAGGRVAEVVGDDRRGCALMN